MPPRNPTGPPHPAKISTYSAGSIPKIETQLTGQYIYKELIFSVEMAMTMYYVMDDRTVWDMATGGCTSITIAEGSSLKHSIPEFRAWKNISTNLRRRGVHESDATHWRIHQKGFRKRLPRIYLSMMMQNANSSS